MGKDQRRPLRLCATCGAVIGEYEPARIEDQDGMLHPSSLLNLAVQARASARQVRHAGCIGDGPLTG